MTVKVIIFDFDGTIADTLDAIVNILNGLSTEFGYKQTTPEELEQLKNLSPQQIIQHSGVSIFKLPSIIRRLKLGLRSEIHRLTPIAGMKEVLIELNNRGNQLGIITSNSKENILQFAEVNGLQDLFNFIYSGATIFGKSKVINNFLKEKHLKHEDVVYVGDEARDIEAARKSKIKVIAVSWGFNSQEMLAAHNPDFLIHQPQEIIEAIEDLQKQII